MAAFGQRWRGSRRPNLPPHVGRRVACNTVDKGRVAPAHLGVAKGWPPDGEVYDPIGKGAKAPPASLDDFSSSSGYNLWGVGRWPRNLPRPAGAARPFKLIEAGFFNFFQSLGKQVAYSGGVMVLLSGSDARAPAQTKRVTLLVSGASYSPNVFEVTHLVFERDADATSPLLDLPCKVAIADRHCLVNTTFRSVATSTSEELIQALVSEMVEVQLHHAIYRVVSQDGTLRWSSIDSVEEVGVLWSAGQALPLLAAGAQERRPSSSARAVRMLDTLMDSDPFGPEHMGANGRLGKSTSKARAKAKSRTGASGLDQSLRLFGIARRSQLGLCIRDICSKIASLHVVCKTQSALGSQVACFAHEQSTCAMA